MKSFHGGIESGSARRDHVGDHCHTPEKAHERGGEIAATGTAQQAGIILKGEHAGQAMPAQKRDHHLEERLGIEIAASRAV